MKEFNKMIEDIRKKAGSDMEAITEKAGSDIEEITEKAESDIEIITLIAMHKEKLPVDFVDSLLSIIRA